MNSLNDISVPLREKYLKDSESDIEEVQNFSLLNLLVPEFHRIGCALTRFKLKNNETTFKEFADKRVYNFVCYIGS